MSKAIVRMIAPAGPRLVERAGVTAGMRGAGHRAGRADRGHRLDAGRFAATLLRLFAEHLPPPPLWGVDGHAQALFATHDFGDVVVERGTMRMWEGETDQLVALYETTFGPAVMARTRVGEEGWPAVREEIARTITAFADDAGDGTVTLDGDYVTIVARRSTPLMAPAAAPERRDGREEEASGWV